MRVVPRLPRGSLAVAAIALVAAVLSALVPGCKGDELPSAVTDYSAAVRPLMDRERRVWERVRTLLTDTDRLSQYFRFLEEEAAPFYEDMGAEVGRIQPGHEAVAPTHDVLLRFVETRTEFVALELRSRRNAEHVLVAQELQRVAGTANLAARDYARAVAEGVPDARFTEITQITQAFQRDFLEGLRTRRVTEEQFKDRLTLHVLPRLREIRNGKFPDDEAGRALREAVVRCLDYHEAVLEGAHSLAIVFHQTGDSQHLVDEGEKLLAGFLEQLTELRRRRE